MTSKTRKAGAPKATIGSILIALGVVVIFFIPIVAKFQYPGSSFAVWITSGFRAVWFYVVAYSLYILFFYWLDHRKKQAARAANEE